MTDAKPPANKGPDPLGDFTKGFTEDEAEAITRYQEIVQHSKMLGQICKSMEDSASQFSDIIYRIKVTFWSIQAMNWILIGMAVVMFAGAVYSALGGRYDVTAVLTLTGFGSILSVFTFSMNRVQTSLGDQVQVQIAYNSFIKQLLNFDEHFEFSETTDQIKEINLEIQKLTQNSMELVQKFTKIGTASSSQEPWENPFPIRFGKIEGPKEVVVGDDVTFSGTLKNEGDKPVTLTSLVIAVRPPQGTPSGGPFTYDFAVQTGREIKPGETITIKNTKKIEVNLDPNKTNPPIPPEYLNREWYAYVTCQTKDGIWHDDPSKFTFTVTDKKASTPQSAPTPAPVTP